IQTAQLEEYDPEFTFLACLYGNEITGDDGYIYHKCSFVDLGDGDPNAAFQAMYEMRSNPRFGGVAAIQSIYTSLFTNPSIGGMKDALMHILPGSGDFPIVYGQYLYSSSPIEYADYIESGSYFEMINEGALDLTKLRFEVKYPSSEQMRTICNPFDWPRFD
ncbi:MAG: hypothetical protein PHX74_11055, partial [Candidatus Sumerlaeales bacterium]|nr:hypothetical protein [Candidatus Sumerlaeales bacterium]